MIPAEIQNDYATLVSNVHAPIFFEKLASEYGIVPQTEDDKTALLELAGILQVENAKHSVKQASAPGPFVGVVDELKGALNTSSATSHETSLDRLIKSAADQFLSDSNVAESAFNWGAFQMAGTAAS